MTPDSPERLGGGFYAALAYIATTAICVWLLKHPLADAAVGLRAVVSLLPVVAIGFLVRALVRRVLAGDELQRRIDLEAIAVASVLVGLGSLTLGLLATAGVVHLTARQVLLWVLPALVLGYGAAKLWAARRY